MPPIAVQHPIPEAQRGEAAAIYYAAFRQKLSPLLGGDGKALPTLGAALDLGCAFGAFEDERLLGVLGFQHDHRKFANYPLGHLACVYGWPSAVARWGFFVIAERTPVAGQLLMDGLAVHADARGRGIGTRMFDSLFAFAHANGYTSIRLDVVDTNPRARQLYEQLGFQATETARFPYLRRVLGFGAVTTMIKALDRLL